MLEAKWGTEEYFEQRGEKRGEKRAVKKIVKLLKEEGMSKDEIQRKLSQVGLSYE